MLKMINPLCGVELIENRGIKMILSDGEVLRLRRLLWEIDKGLEKTRYKAYVETRTRNIRLMLTKAERREKNTLL